MGARSRLSWLEEQLDRDDLTDLQYESYNSEANAIQDQLNKEKTKRDLMIAARRKEEQEEIEMEKILSLTEEQVEKMYEDSCLKYQDVNGMSFRNWYSKSLKYYQIDATFNVHARARSTNTVEIVPHPSIAQAKLTILKRIKHKFYDHAVRGCEFRWDVDDIP